MSAEIWRGKRVLVVEDEAMVAMMIEDMLGELDCTVVATAARLEKALLLADSLDIDVAILDLNLDGKLTYEVADRLAGRRIPFLFSTGYGAASLPERLRASPTLSKPFQQAALAQAIARVLRPSHD
jgi:CheY-like chemotaxis protein